jgi:hypothetical protein
VLCDELSGRLDPADGTRKIADALAAATWAVAPPGAAADV